MDTNVIPVTEKSEVSPALTLLNFDDGRPGPWAVTMNDYGPNADSVSTITTFNTKEEAEAFIAECRRGQHCA